MKLFDIAIQGPATYGKLFYLARNLRILLERWRMVRFLLRIDDERAGTARGPGP